MFVKQSGDHGQSRAVICKFVILCFCLLFSGVPKSWGQKPVQAAQAPIKEDTTQKDNDRIAQLAIAASAKQGEYLIGNGDLLSVEVFDVPELSREVRVNESGLISIPLLPVKVQAAGLTPFQLQDELAELLRANGLVSKPQVTITLKEIHSEPITVIGAVKTPMVIQATHPMTLLEVISQVGGIEPDAGSQLIITRAPPPADPSGAPGVQGKPVSIVVDLNDLLDSGNSQYNIPLFGGDVLRVPRSGVIYVVGAVQHAGGFVMQTDRQQLTVLKAMSLAGGLQPTAKPQQAVIVRRDIATGKQEEVPVDIQKIMKLKSDDVKLEQSDILYVPDSFGKHAARRAGDVAVSLISGIALVRATAVP